MHQVTISDFTMTILIQVERLLWQQGLKYLMLAGGCIINWGRSMLPGYGRTCVSSLKVKIKIATKELWGSRWRYWSHVCVWYCMEINEGLTIWRPKQHAVDRMKDWEIWRGGEASDRASSAPGPYRKPRLHSLTALGVAWLRLSTQAAILITHKSHHIFCWPVMCCAVLHPLPDHISS